MFRYKEAVAIIFSLLLLSGCTDTFRGYFKRSANNKLFDSKGFEGGKRKPLYNRKYISLAKKNIVEENFDDDTEIGLDDEEQIDPSIRNRQMYKDMVKREAARKKRQRFEAYKSPYNTIDDQDGTYPSFSKASKRVQEQNNNDQTVQRELEQIKAMLNEAKKDLAKYKCPMQPPAEEQKPQSSKNSSSVNSSEEKKVVAPKKSKSVLKEKFITTEDDYKKIKNNETEEEPKDSTSAHPI